MKKNKDSNIEPDHPEDEQVSQGKDRFRSSSPKTMDRLWIIVAVVVFILSVLAMVNGIHVKSLLLDEAFFARNLRMFPAGYGFQSAPTAPLFYFLSYVFVSLLGDAEWVLRLLPLLSAIAGLAFTGVFLWKTFSRLSALIAFILTASSIPLIEYGANAHPYATDFIWAVVLLALGYSYVQRPVRKNWYSWIVACFFAIAFSLPALFIIAAFSVVLMAKDLREKSTKAFWDKMKGLIPLAIYIGCLGIFIYLPKAGSRQDMFYWEGNFPGSLLPWTVFKWVFASTNKLLGYLFFSYQEGLIGLFLLLLGTAWMLKKNRYVLCGMCWGPVLLSVCAAVFQKWPYGPLRVMLFALPFFVVLMASGLELIWESVRNNSTRLIIIIACVALLIPQSWILTQGFERIEDSEEAVRSLSEAVHPDVLEDDIFIVYYAAEVQFQYYFSEYADPAVIQSWDHRGRPADMNTFLESNIPERGRRFWLVFSHVVEDEDEAMVSMAETWARRIKSYEFSGCGAFLFESVR